MKVGDLVMRTYGAGRRPVALLVGWYKPGTGSELAEVMWLGIDRVEQISLKYLEVTNETATLVDLS
jgi:hypothetical protein